jgi:Trypsin
MQACEQTQLLVGGTPTADIFALSAAQRHAIGRVWPIDDPHGQFCTGVQVAPRWVLTARHCDTGGAFEYETPEADDRAARSIRVIAAYRQLEHDALLLELEVPASAESIGLIADPADTARLLGVIVNLAGYGVDANGQPARELNFLAQPVVGVDDANLDVDGRRRTGACRGDSGGPLLFRDRAGVLRVAGILSRGSRSCTRTDHYLRVDLLREWMHALGVPLETGSAACDGVSASGFCRSGSAIYCEAGTLRADSCDDPLACGWSASARGYRCLDPAEDSCEGFDDLGGCADGVATRCHAGELTRSDCAACDRKCEWSAGTGHYACL